MMPIWAKALISVAFLLPGFGSLGMAAAMVRSAIIWRSAEPLVLAAITLALAALGAVIGIGVWFP